MDCRDAATHFFLQLHRNHGSDIYSGSIPITQGRDDMFGFGKKNKEKANEAATHTGKSLERIDESIKIIEEVLMADIRSFFSNNRNLETLVAKMKNEELSGSLGMMAMSPTDENLKKAKLACDRIKVLYAKG